jgi:hypothetical protein
MARRLMVACLLVWGMVGGSVTASAYSLIGAGADSCAIWTADRQDPKSKASLQDTSWVRGFLSGIGFVGSEKDDPLDGVEAVDVDAWIDKYCLANSVKSIAAAAAAFYYYHPHK